MERRYPSTSADWRHFPAVFDADGLLIGGWQVMHTWQRALMAALAEAVTRTSGNVLEVGFGMGISASEIIARGCRSYTCIEAHPVVAERARLWAKTQPVEVTVVEAFWEDVIDTLGPRFDAVLFDTYPLNPEERGRNHFPFIPVARKLLKPNGVLTYYSDETTRFRAEHLHLLLSHFKRVELIRVDGLQPPADWEYWSADHMIVPIASQPIEAS